MTSAEWRALLEAYLDGRLSAEAFMRRFLDAWRAGGAIPAAIADLQVAVEAFEAEVGAAREQGVANDDDLRVAALRALQVLRDGIPAGARTFDRARAREEMARFQVNASRLVGVGCLIALVWIGLSLLQIYFVSEWILTELGWGAWPSAVAGFFLAFVPVIGNVLAFLGASQEGWPQWLAALVFFAAPAATILSGWSRWRRRG